VARPSEELEFDAERPEAVARHMERLGAVHRGWINVQPAIREEDAPASPTPLGLLFSADLYEVPVCTWVAGSVARHGLAPDSLGVQHATGPRAVARLASLGHPLPDGWRWVQDHPRRGLVVRPPVGTPYGEELTWLIGAGTALSGVPLTGRWRALVYEGR
jgi:hypothetical protein